MSVPHSAPASDLPGDTLIMTRRAALTRMAVLLGGTLIATDAYIYAAPVVAGTTKPLLTPDDFALIDEIGDTIIPPTDTPGAKAAGVSACIATLVADCYRPDHQQLFKEGLKNIDTAAQQRFQKSFRDASPAQRTELLTALDNDQRQARHQIPPPELPHYFQLIKELVVVAYFTSEIGANQALRYIEVPGRFDGNAPYKPGDPAAFVATSRGLG